MARARSKRRNCVRVRGGGRSSTLNFAFETQQLGENSSPCHGGARRGHSTPADISRPFRPMHVCASSELIRIGFEKPAKVAWHGSFRTIEGGTDPKGVWPRLRRCMHVLGGRRSSSWKA